jgi:hypothetical protein
MSNWLNLWIEVYDFSKNVSNNNYNPVNRIYYSSKIMTKLYYLLATNNNNDALDSLIDYLALQNINDTFFIYGLKDILIEIFKYCSDYLKENFPNENDEMRQIDEIQDDYSIDNYY